MEAELILNLACTTGLEGVFLSILLSLNVALGAFPWCSFRAAHTCCRSDWMGSLLNLSNSMLATTSKATATCAS